MINKRLVITGCVIAGGASFIIMGMWPFGVLCGLIALAIYFNAVDAPTPPERGSRVKRTGGRKSS